VNNINTAIHSVRHYVLHTGTTTYTSQWEMVIGYFPPRIPNW